MLLLRVFLVACVVGIGAAQCNSYTRLGSVEGIGLCIGGTANGVSVSTQDVCNAAGNGVETKVYSSADCSGAATTTTTVIGASNIVCNGAPCSVTVRFFTASATCGGTGLTVSSFRDIACSGGEVNFCQNNIATTWNYNDAQCNGAATSVMQLGNGCIGFGSASVQFSGCSSPQPATTPPAGLALELTIYSGANTCGGSFFARAQLPLNSSCSSGIRQFCADNAMWLYFYADQMCSSDSNLTAVLFYQVGCSTALSEIFGSSFASAFGASSGASSGASAGSGATTMAPQSGVTTTSAAPSLDQFTVTLGCLTGGTPPPNFGFGGSDAAFVELYFDSGCTARIMGMYVKADGMCRPDMTTNSSTSTKFTCATNGGVMIEEFNSLNCSAATKNATTSVTLGPTCQALLGAEFEFAPGKTTYAKASGCGTTYTATSGTIDPKSTPGLSGGRRQFYVGLAVVCVVFGRLLF